MYILILFSFAILLLGQYFIWWSRYNVPTHTVLALFPIQYIIPTLILPHIISDYESNIVDLYSHILFLGAIFYLIGIFFGYKFPQKQDKHEFIWQRIGEDNYIEYAAKITKKTAYIAIGGMLFCFLVMGFIPILAEDPLSAKFFRGQYQEPYRRVAIIFRSCNYILQLLVPLLLILWYLSKKRIYLILLISSILILVMCFARATAFSGLILGIGVIVASQKKALFKYYIFSLFFIYALGSATFYIIGILTDNSLLLRSDIDANIFEIMVAGAPDIDDQLNFLSKFINNPEYTYGQTFWGGLIPGHYYWNPSVWTLKVVTAGADVNDVVSGGLRLPLPLWGYVSFSWVGVIFLSLSSGILCGYFVRKVKFIISETDNVVIHLVSIMLFINIYKFFINFHTMSIYALPPIFIMLFYLKKIKVKL